jgi:hypothetical protein
MVGRSLPLSGSGPLGTLAMLLTDTGRKRHDPSPPRSLIAPKLYRDSGNLKSNGRTAVVEAEPFEPESLSTPGRLTQLDWRHPPGLAGQVY